MAAATNDDEYLECAGMWGRDLAAQLLWYTEGDGTLKAIMCHGQRKLRAGHGHGLSRRKDWLCARDNGRALPPSLTERKFHLAEVVVGSLSLHGYSREISGICSIDSVDAWLAEMRKEYPWGLLVSESDDESARIAHGALDDPNGITSAHRELIHVPVCNG